MASRQLANDHTDRVLYQPRMRYNDGAAGYFDSTQRNHCCFQRIEKVFHQLLYALLRTVFEVELASNHNSIEPLWIVSGCATMSGAAIHVVISEAANITHRRTDRLFSSTF
jgi:hypothetical protein